MLFWSRYEPSVRTAGCAPAGDIPAVAWAKWAFTEGRNLTIEFRWAEGQLESAFRHIHSTWFADRSTSSSRKLPAVLEVWRADYNNEGTLLLT